MERDTENNEANYERSNNVQHARYHELCLSSSSSSFSGEQHQLGIYNGQ